MIDENGKIIFNMSPSALGLFSESELRFYYSYILRCEADTKVVQCYGKAGTNSHDNLELAAHYMNENNTLEGFNILESFDLGWEKFELNKLIGFNGKPLDKSKYIKGVNNGLKILKSFKDCKFKCEEEIVFPLLKTDKYEVNCKGFIDIQIFEDGKLTIRDWKTSGISAYTDSSKLETELVKEGKANMIGDVLHFNCDINKMPQFVKQLLHYAYSVYKKHNIFAESFAVEYINLGKTKKYHFSEEQIISYEQYLKKMLKLIILKGSDISKYELGDITSIFNEHLKKCVAEKERRENNTLANTNELTAVIKNKKLFLFKGFNQKLINIINKKYQYNYFIWKKLLTPQGRPIIKANGKPKMKQVEVTKKYLKIIRGQRYLPQGFKHDLIQLIKDYNKYYKTDYKLNIVNKTEHTLMHSNTMPDKLKGITLYDFQQEAVDIFLEKEQGILFCSVSAGKTEIAAEIIRKLDLKCLFLVHRKELMDQTFDRFNKRGLNNNIMMYKLDSTQFVREAHINVSMVQTLANRLHLKETKDYLKEVDLVIIDEFHHAITGNQYKKILDLTDAKYLLGLTGSLPDEPKYRLGAKEVIGDIIYTIDSNTLMDKNIISRPEVNMITIDHMYETGKWQDLEKSNIIRHEGRNEKIKEICLHEKGLKLIIVKKIEHGEILRDMIPQAVFLSGQDSKEFREETMNKINNNKIEVIISTLIGEGVDIPHISTIIIACGMGRTIIQTIQNAGRVLRKFIDSEGKQMKKKLFDFNDINCDYLEEHAGFRKTEYNKYAEVNIIGKY